ncbi:MAG: ECF-type sigma factor [Bryobacteraceae bacterium]
MKQVLVDASRRKDAIKRGEGAVKITLDDQMEAKTWTIEQLLVLNEFLDQLRAQDARKADVVECRFYLGLSDQEIAAEFGISVATVERDWQFARAWLNARVKD